MTKTIWMLGLLGAVAAGAFACSGSTASTGGGANACLQNAAGNSCYSCVQNNCGSSLSTFQSACGPFVDCMCSGGSYNGCNLQACSNQISQACSSATSGLTSCSACASQCSGFSLSSCSSGGSSGGFSSSGSGGSPSSCVQQGLNKASGACSSCVETSCASQLATFESGCTAYLACICPGGVFNACNETSCAGQITSGCTASANAVGTCETSSCANQCASSSSSSGGTTCSSGGSSGSSGGTSGSSGGGTTCSGSQSCPASGNTLQFCVVGTESSCYYQIGSQTFSCNSCTDVTSCAQAAAAACQ